MTQQELRDALCVIEDEARTMRNQHRLNDRWAPSETCDLIARLAQLVREEIVE